MSGFFDVAGGDVRHNLGVSGPQKGGQSYDWGGMAVRRHVFGVQKLKDYGAQRFLSRVGAAPTDGYYRYKRRSRSGSRRKRKSKSRAKRSRSKTKRRRKGKGLGRR